MNDLAKEHEDEESKKYGQEQKFVLQPLADIHFNENYGIYDWSKGQASKSLLTSLALVALFLLLLGCINFINLNTAQASQRAKEIGIRKVLGASINSVVLLLTKDFIKLVIIAFLIAVPISYLLMQRWLENYTYKIDIEW